PAYKDSGVEWLGEIPQHWDALKTKRLTLVKRGASPRPIDDPIYFDDEGDYSWVRISDVTASDKYLLTTEQKLSEIGKSKSVPLEPGELFLSIAASVGKPIITRIKCCIHDGFVYFVGLKQNREYLFYLFRGGSLYTGLGKTGTQLNLNTDTIGDIKIPIPPLAEQRAIAAFLDRETGRLDTLVAKKERLLELLQEQRAALISHAVTKGLDRTAPMKDSGVEWLGEIPAHWEIIRLKNVVQINPEVLQENTDSEYQIKYLDISNVETGGNVLEFQEMVFANAPSRARRKVKHGDTVISTVRTYLKAISFIDNPPGNLIVSTGFAVLRPESSIAPEYLFRIVQSEEFVSRVVAYSVGVSYPAIAPTELASLKIWIPPLAEQRAIAAFLDRETAKIDTLVKKIEEGIARLKEYRAALISAAVTGKIDVRL
ncbi:restriction endonuclease subunit S, partial [Candidatus Chlorohelix sp.]|uniref:restriction endonuclease subunit S n=1 Tax=Candidatus Chlorohelix sp. TaxID=3139201 RepID=UPI0030578347